MMHFCLFLLLFVSFILCSGHCRQLAPKWRKVAESLHGVVRVAAVNCEGQNAALCQGQRVQSYPTIKAFRQGRWIEYRGDRSAAPLRDWGLSLLPSDTVSVISQSAQMHEYLKKSSAASKWGAAIVLFTSKSDTSALYKSLALRYKSKLAFAEVRGGATSDLAKRFNISSFPTLLAVCGGDEQSTVSYQGEMKNSRLAKWLNAFYSGKKCLESIKFDANTDFGKLKVSQLKSILESQGKTCKDCVEKSDYVRRIKEMQ